MRNEQQAQVRAALSTRAIPAVSSSAVAASTSPSSLSTTALSSSSSTAPVASSPLYRWNLIMDPGIGFAKSGAHAVSQTARQAQRLLLPFSPSLHFLLSDVRSRVWFDASVCDALVCVCVFRCACCVIFHPSILTPTCLCSSALVAKDSLRMRSGKDNSKCSYDTKEERSLKEEQTGLLLLLPLRFRCWIAIGAPAPRWWRASQAVRLSSAYMTCMRCDASEIWRIRCTRREERLWPDKIVATFLSISRSYMRPLWQRGQIAMYGNTRC